MTTSALAVAAALCAAAALIAWLRARRALRLERVAFRLAREREQLLVEGARRLGLAARRSPTNVCGELDRALRALAPALDSVLIFDDEDGSLRCVFASGERVALFLGTRIARSDARTLPVRALAAGHRVQLAPGEPSFHPNDAFAVAVPLASDAGRTSVVYAAAPAALSAPVVDSVVALIDHAGFAYGLSRERDADRRRAEFDALTGLLTPRALRERLSTTLERARFAPLARVALLFIDTDHFKVWNDTFGHASGDALLRALAGLLRGAASRDDELAARNGGDEFCVVLVDTEKSQALERAERLRAAIASLDLDALRPPGSRERVTISASIGVAAYPVDASDAHDLLERADAAMYHSKRTGRNAVSYFGVDGAPVRAEAAVYQS